MASVKICGLTRESDIEDAIQAGADRVGFVVVRQSPALRQPRELVADRQPDLSPPLGGWAQAWVVTDWTAADRGPTDKFDALISELNEVHAVQLHGGETPEEVADFKRRAPRVRWSRR